MRINKHKNTNSSIEEFRKKIHYYHQLENIKKNIR